MATNRGGLLKEAAARGKYAPLHRHLLWLWPGTEWRAGFGEVERVPGFRLPCQWQSKIRHFWREFVPPGWVPGCWPRWSFV